MNKTIVLTAVIALVVGLGIGYEGAGLLHPATATQTARGNFTGTGNFARTGAGGTAGAGLLSGTVATKDSGSITLDTRDGSSHVVLVTPDTTISKSVSGTEDDVTVGSTVIVSGTTNSDGSVSASSVQLRPTAPPATVQ
ncbi:MAG: hypothetical protein ABSB00_01185 [Minisyncoccia bacterium]|jgi:hypothetical protein